MPIVDHSSIPETPWRPNYRQFNITRPGDGTTSSSMDLGIVGVGAGAPLHVHEADELIVVLEGTLEVRLGEEVLKAGPDHTLVIPPNVPHGFTCVGPDAARIIGFFPVPDSFAHTTYLEGQPPQAHSR